MHTGSCLCGAVRFQIEGALPAPTACHCRRCRKWTGHFEASTDVARAALTIEGGAALAWYHSSEKVRRGFCSVCGASLFFEPLDRAKHDWIGVAMGAFDTPTGVELARHIFVADKGDYYQLSDGLPQNDQ
jgi:hypothetical protein